MKEALQTEYRLQGFLVRPLPGYWSGMAAAGNAVHTGRTAENRRFPGNKRRETASNVERDSLCSRYAPAGICSHQTPAHSGRVTQLFRVVFAARSSPKKKRAVSSASFSDSKV